MATEQWPEKEWPTEQSPGSDEPHINGEKPQPGRGYAVAPVLTREYLKWLVGGPASLGPVFCLGFRINGSLVGITVCRIEASKIGRKARLIHLHSSKLDVQILKWMITENVHRVTKFHAESVHIRSSCHSTNIALTGLGFRSTACAAVMTRFNNHSLPEGEVNITFLRGDDAMIPSLIAE